MQMGGEGGRKSREVSSLRGCGAARMSLLASSPHEQERDVEDGDTDNLHGRGLGKLL